MLVILLEKCPGDEAKLMSTWLGTDYTLSYSPLLKCLSRGSDRLVLTSTDHFYSPSSQPETTLYVQYVYASHTQFYLAHFESLKAIITMDTLMYVRLVHYLTSWNPQARVLRTDTWGLPTRCWTRLNNSFSNELFPQNWTIACDRQTAQSSDLLIMPVARVITGIQMNLHRSNTPRFVFEREVIN